MALLLRALSQMRTDPRAARAVLPGVVAALTTVVLQPGEVRVKRRWERVAPPRLTRLHAVEP